jgi:hypothetical protein
VDFPRRASTCSPSNHSRPRASIRRVVTCASNPPASDRDPIEFKVRTAAITTQNVVVTTGWQDGSGYILEHQIFDLDAVGRGADRAAVQVVLLDVQTVPGGPTHVDVLVGNATDETGCVVVGLDTHAVFRGYKDRVGKANNRISGSTHL